MSADLKYTEEHEWIRLEGDVATIGITQYAKDALGELVYVELPEAGDDVAKGDDFAVVESVKVASEVYSPVTGTIAAVNDALGDDPDVLNDPLCAGWMVKITTSDPSELDGLMDKAAYDDYVQGLD